MGLARRHGLQLFHQLGRADEERGALVQVGAESYVYRVKPDSTVEQVRIDRTFESHDTVTLRQPVDTPAAEATGAASEAAQADAAVEAVETEAAPAESTEAPAEA